MFHDYIFAADSIRFIISVIIIVENFWYGDIGLCLYLMHSSSVSVWINGEKLR